MIDQILKKLVDLLFQRHQDVQDVQVELLTPAVSLH
jgi:hypothetical protein